MMLFLQREKSYWKDLMSTRKANKANALGQKKAPLLRRSAFSASDLRRSRKYKAKGGFNWNERF
jgi:hypothetical protein